VSEGCGLPGVVTGGNAVEERLHLTCVVEAELVATQSEHACCTSECQGLEVPASTLSLHALQDLMRRMRWNSDPHQSDVCLMSVQSIPCVDALTSLTRLDVSRTAVSGGCLASVSKRCRRLT
jgi:hypothetical protein